MKYVGFCVNLWFVNTVRNWQGSKEEPTWELSMTKIDTPVGRPLYRYGLRGVHSQNHFPGGIILFSRVPFYRPREKDGTKWLYILGHLQYKTRGGDVYIYV